MADKAQRRYQRRMAEDDKPRYQPRPVETEVQVRAELRRRGMSEAEIDRALRKKKRRAPLEMASKARHVLWEEGRRLPDGVRPLPRDELCTVDFAAEHLKLHPKTVLRFIRDGRLPAKRIGKAYRIRRVDIDALAGSPPPAEASGEEARITSIVELPDVDADMARKWSRSVTNALNAKPPGSPFRADVIYDPTRAHLKIVLVGPPAEVVNLLNLVRVWQEQLTP
jgi:excisionase family DNA binding protein